MFKHLLYIFIGGGLGSVLRYLISKTANNPENLIPYGTLTVNVVGSLLIGVVMGFALKNSSAYQPLILTVATGFCGGFTTFSAFSFENYVLLKNGDYLSFMIYFSLSLLLGIIAVVTGVFLVKNF
ncbi:fluoride efflux transporter CrcB [Aquimarina brevivitae]|uniref:Fluoride-specific ion channel FluC n=1 Tax=Aquimarina brevivitae TaxID=323412 RepID=A0A4Q7PMH5_9FLAO|nr:fluoride efflux transporter CrcB [Aquimarina brevivitae]RZT00213.1 camphor resistance protein CrcB [Aquimarina brevivitae]